MVLIRDLSKYDHAAYTAERLSGLAKYHQRVISPVNPTVSPQVDEAVAPIDFSLYDGFFIRTYDGTGPDPMFSTNKAGAVAVGKPWSSYQFYDWFYPARPQVHSALAVLGSDPGAQPTAFDVESWGPYAYPPQAQLLDGMFGLYDEYLKTTGKVCAFYLNVGCMIYLSPIPAWLASTTLWIADWRGQAAPGPIKGWANWRYWQYQGDPDLSHFNGTAAQFSALWNVTPATRSKVTVIANALNVRVGPGTNYGILEQVAKGTVLEVQDIGGLDAWVKVVTADGKMGWICVQQKSTRFVNVL